MMETMADKQGGSCCGGCSGISTCSTKQRTQGRDADDLEFMRVAAAALPFGATDCVLNGNGHDDNDGDLEALAVIPPPSGVVPTDARKKPSCAFQLDGKPCKLCQEDEEPEESQAEAEEETCHINPAESSRYLCACNSTEDKQEYIEQIKNRSIKVLLEDVVERKEKLFHSTPCTASNETHQAANTASLSSCCSSTNSRINNQKKCNDDDDGLDAYERKKQRAKATRAQLNDALDRLGTTMQHTSEQAIVRTTLELGDQFYLKPLQTTIPTSAQYHPYPHCHPKEQFHKVDRPKFVNAAADMLQEVNAHCNTLAQEVLQLRSKLSAAEKQQQASSCCCNGGISSILSNETPSFQSNISRSNNVTSINKSHHQTCCSKNDNKRQHQACCSSIDESGSQIKQQKRCLQLE